MRNILYMWKFIRALIWRLNFANTSMLAASLSFNSVLALVPLLAISLAVFHYIGGMEQMLLWIQKHIMEYFIFGTHHLIMDKITSAVQRVHSGALGGFGVVFIFLTCSRLFNQFDYAVQRIWQNEQRKMRWKQLALFWVFLLLGPLSLSIVLGVLSKMLLEGRDFQYNAYMGYIALYGLLALTYKLMPNSKVNWHIAFAVSFLSILSLVFAKSTYIKVTSDLMAYNRVYGSVAALPIFLVWVLFLWWLILFGVAVCAQWQKPTQEEKNTRPSSNPAD